MNDPRLICTCESCGLTWEVDFDNCPCECDEYTEWRFQIVVIDD